MDQISSIEHFLEPGEVAISNEVAQQASLPSTSGPAPVLCAMHLGTPVKSAIHVLQCSA